MNPGASVIDFGCGPGRTIEALLERHVRDLHVTGVDLQLAPVTERFASDPRVTLIDTNLDRPLPFPEETFDGAICHNVLECLERPYDFLDEARRVLTTGGHLLLGHADFDTMVFSS